MVPNSGRTVPGPRPTIAKSERTVGEIASTVPVAAQREPFGQGPRADMKEAVAGEKSRSRKTLATFQEPRMGEIPLSFSKESPRDLPKL